jgi:beta-galactosidase
VRINESGDNHDFYTRTNNLARQLDPSRPTGGVRNFRNSEFLEDVYTYNDFSGTAQDPAVLPWLITESVGHTAPDRSWDPESVQVGTMRVHLNVQNTAAGKANISGAMGWAAFDYNTTFVTPPSCVDFTCYHGVSDIFRIPKIAATAFASQRDPALYGPYVSIASQWTPGVSSGTVLVGSNCQQIELFVNGASRGRINPNAFTNLPHPMFQFTGLAVASGQLRADCWIGGQLVATDTRFTPGAATHLALVADDTAIRADGADMTRVVVKALDSNNQVVPTNAAPVTFAVTGPGAVVGESPLVLEAGTGAVYLKSALGQTGTLALTASAPGLSSAGVSVTTTAFTDPIVPPSGSYAFRFPVDINDRQRFSYSGSWQAATDSQAFSKDNTFSATAGDTATLSFTGDRVVVYGVQDPAHGSAAISVDGGTERTVSFQGTPRRADVALYNSVPLTQGQHTLRVRVVGNGAVALDRAIVVSTAPAVVAPPPPATGGPQAAIVGTQSGRCVDVPNSTTVDGTQVQLWDCNGGANQRFTQTTSRQLMVFGSKCLDAFGQGTANGTMVVIWACNGGTNQQWNINANGTITGVQSGLCLDATGAGTANGTRLILWSCNGGANQRWTLRPS